MRWHIAIASDLRVVGFNPESADLDRPRGEIIREVFFLQATNDRGNRRSFGGWLDLNEADNAVLNDPTVPPVFMWSEDRPEYGSIAYQQDGGEEDQMESERRHNEAEGYGFDTRFSIF